MKERWFPRLKKESEMQRSNKRRNFERSDWQKQNEEFTHEKNAEVIELNRMRKIK